MKTHDVPSPEKWIERLDRLAASGKYDDVALAFPYQALVYDWDENKLLKVETLMGQGQRPEAFIGFKWQGSRLDLRIWWSPSARSGMLTLPTSERAHRLR